MRIDSKVFRALCDAIRASSVDNDRRLSELRRKLAAIESEEKRLLAKVKSHEDRAEDLEAAHDRALALWEESVPGGISARDHARIDAGIYEGGEP